ncbi:MAG: DUF1643 domain-containing protein [Solirubrobacteraceae bacterium]|nr:DUF1643 domain-containing protein [Solirubrobacteraceae bacterium]
MPIAPPTQFTAVRRSARFSRCSRHRLLLERHWDEGPLVGFVMLNPSTADHARDDATIGRCTTFARDWGFGGLLVANLFTLRSTDPRILTLTTATSRNADGADEALDELAERCDLIVEAWGAHRTVDDRASAVRTRVARSGTELAVLGRTKDGHPRHPLYVPALTAPVDAFSGRAITLPS